MACACDARLRRSGRAALKYLAPYVFRVALSNNRLVGVANDQVTFRYRDGSTKKTKCCTLPATAFIGRFLQHALPRGFVKVRYFGLFRPGNRQVLAQLRSMLCGPAPPDAARPTADVPTSTVPSVPDVMRCPVCGSAMELTQIVQPKSRSPPATTVAG